jgi:hypothetical protein
MSLGMYISTAGEGFVVVLGVAAVDPCVAVVLESIEMYRQRRQVEESAARE